VTRDGPAQYGSSHNEDTQSQELQAAGAGPGMHHFAIEVEDLYQAVVGLQTPEDVLDFAASFYPEARISGRLLWIAHKRRHV